MRSEAGRFANKVAIVTGAGTSGARSVPVRRRRSCSPAKGPLDHGVTMVGEDISLALDFGYRWRDWHDAAALMRRIDDLDIEFAEAPLWHGDLHGHARLAAVSPVRIGGAEFATGRWEIREWLETGGVSLVQPGVSRAGGFTELPCARG